MGQADSIRATVRNLINTLGSGASLYSYDSATKTHNEEGDVSITWGGATAIKVISSNHFKLKRILALQGEENNEGDRVVLIKDDVTIGHRDKLTIGTDVYLVDEIKKIDPIESTLIAQRVVLSKDDNY